MNIFNTIAYLCSFIIRSCEEDFFVRYSCISNKAKQRISSEIFKRTGSLLAVEEGSGASGAADCASTDGDSSGVVCAAGDSAEEKTVRQLTHKDLNDEFFSTLDALIQEFIQAKDYFSIVTLIQILDEGVETILKEKIAEFQADDFSVVLNTNREDTGVGLLPRCSCMWERKHRLSHSYNRMDNFLFNLLLMENVILGELIDKHIFLKKDFFNNLSERKKLKIAATPLRIEAKYEDVFYEEDNVSYDAVKLDESDAENDNLLVWNKILLARDEETDIIVFPEILGNTTTVSFIQGKIQELSREEQQKLPSLIILPSVWYKKRNTVTILGNTGEIIATQSKQNPYRMVTKNQSFLEAITANNVINIFHYEGIGRFAILICKDFLTTKYMEQIMRCFKLTLIIVPSYSTGSYDFIRSFDLCAHDDCNVVWINSCAAMEKGKESNFENIGYVRKRISRSEDEAQMLCKMPICKDALEGKCAHNCIFYETISAV